MVATAARSFTAAYAGGEMTIRVPEAHLAGVISFTDLPPLPDLAAAVLERFEHPTAGPPLSRIVRPGATVALLTGDRITDRMLGSRDHLAAPILDYLNRLGVPDENITLVYACGLHVHGSVDAKLGPLLPARVRVVKHRGDQPEDLAFLGATTAGTPLWVNQAVANADHVIAMGEISPVMFGGFCGGGKIILPGCAGIDSIDHNHRMIINPRVSIGLVEGNIMRADMEEAADMARLAFKLDVLVNAREQAVAVYGGEFRAEWRAALPRCREIWTTPVPRADIHVFSPSDGREKALGSSLYLSLDAAGLATKPGGTIIALISAIDGWGPPFDPWGSPTGADTLRLSTPEIASVLVRRVGNGRINAQMYSNKRVLEQFRVFVVAQGLDDADARSFGFAGAYRTCDEALGRALADYGPSASVTVNLPRGIGWRQKIRLDDAGVPVSP